MKYIIAILAFLIFSSCFHLTAQVNSRILSSSENIKDYIFWHFDDVQIANELPEADVDWILRQDELNGKISP